MQGTVAAGEPGRRTTVAIYPRYQEAQRAVDYLADQGFPVEKVAIVAEGLRLVEQITGRLTFPRVAVTGGATGAATGAFFGFIIGLLNLTAPFVSGVMLALYGFLVGAVVGALISIVLYAMSGGRRDFASATGFQAERYNLVVDDEFAPQAAGLLRNLPAA